MRILALLAIAATACTGTDAPVDDSPDDSDTEVVPPFDRFVFTTEALASESGTAPSLDCYTPGDDFADTVWATPSLDVNTQVSLDIDILVEDFESDFPVADAVVEVWTDDQVEGSPDFDAVSDDNGGVSFSGFPVCQPFSTRVSTEPELDQTKVSISAHVVSDFSASPPSQDTFTSVSTTTFKLIPSILGITPDPERSIVAGTAYDCGRAQRLENAQIVIYDASGEVADPDVVKVKYFTDEFPDAFREATSPDGLWVAVNVPPGTLRVEMWGYVAGSHQLLGATQIQSYADSINLGNLTAGNGDGVFYPESCLSR